MYKFIVTEKELTEVCFPESQFFKGFCGSESTATFFEKFKNGIQAVIDELIKYPDATVPSGKLIADGCMTYVSNEERWFHLDLMEELGFEGKYFLQFHWFTEEFCAPEIVKRLEAHGIQMQ